ncbi:protein kinase domain-containing protein [Haematococcus lacustris]|uniref:Protein kinase domain-containing protein n=1 Tax=Haematococcus lacustris TaxID=44745 RepID=A0A699ZGC7_HAELA|nr:protein kinase domain-containing protein [Haematococcus lacustris]
MINLASDIAILTEADGIRAVLTTSAFQLPGVWNASTLVLETRTNLTTLGAQFCHAQANFTDVTVSSSSIVIGDWSFRAQAIKSLTITCSGVTSTSVVSQTRCAAGHVSSNKTFAATVMGLQEGHDNITVFLAPEAPFWMLPSHGWGNTSKEATTAPVIISKNVVWRGADPGSYTWLDFQAAGAQILIRNNATLLLWGLGLNNCDMAAPYTFPASSMIAFYWNFVRNGTSTVRLTLQNVLHIASPDTYSYLAYWYARYLSPISVISDSANWISGASNFRLERFTLALSPNGSNTIVVAVKHYNSWLTRNVTMIPGSLDSKPWPLLPSLQHTGILDWAVDPFTALPSAATASTLGRLQASLAAAAVQPYVIQTSDLQIRTCTNSSSSVMTPLAKNSGGRQLLASRPIPFSSPVPGPSCIPPINVLADATMWWQGHPLLNLTADLQNQASLLKLNTTTHITIRNLTLMNLAYQNHDSRGEPHPLASFSAALWAIEGVSDDTSIELDRVTLVVPPVEFRLLHIFATGASSCDCTLPAQTQALLARSLNSASLTSASNDTLTFAIIHLSRWSGTRVTITSNDEGLPYELVLDSPLNTIVSLPAPASNGSNATLRWAVPLAVLGSLVIAGLGLGLLWRARRKAATSSSPQQPAQDQISCTVHLAKQGLAKPFCRHPGTLDFGRANAAAHVSLLPHFDDGDPELTAKAEELVMGAPDWHLRHQGATSPPPTVDMSGALTSEHMMDIDTVLQQVSTTEGADSASASQLVISGVLGVGANAVVYEGLWRGIRVAVKCMLFQEARSNAKRQALQEAAINSRLAHPNIVNTFTFQLRPVGSTISPDQTEQQLLESGTMTIAEEQEVAGDWKMYIIQEYCDGGTLKSAVDSGAFKLDGHTPDMLTIVQVALDIACGLQHIHSNNIIHGDLSPANLLLKSEAGRPGCLNAIAKVGDFGLSHEHQEGQTHVSNKRQGTPYYTAPEVLLDGHMTKAADIFSLGVILHELYNGRPAWRWRPPTLAAPTARIGAVSPAASQPGGGSGQTPPVFHNPANSSGSVGSSGTKGGPAGSDQACPMSGTPMSTQTGSSGAGSGFSLPAAGPEQGRHLDRSDMALKAGAGTATSGAFLDSSGGVPPASKVSCTSTEASQCLLDHQQARATMKALQRWLLAPEKMLASCPLPFPSQCPACAQQAPPLRTTSFTRRRCINARPLCQSRLLPAHQAQTSRRAELTRRQLCNMQRRDQGISRADGTGPRIG